MALRIDFEILTYLPSITGDRLPKKLTENKIKSKNYTVIRFWVAELGILSLGAKMAMKIFVKRVFTIFATNALFLRIIANLQIQLS